MATRAKVRADDARAPKTRVRASVLRDALRDVTGVVEGRSTIPILSTVLLCAQDQRITVTATDLDQQAVRDCASDDRDGPDSGAWLDGITGFSACVPGLPLQALLGEIDGDAMVVLELADGRLKVSAGAARFRLPVLPVDDFPLLGGFDVAHDFEMPCAELSDALGAVDHAISTEEARYYLNGVYVHPVELSLRFAATDGHRLARWRQDGPVGSTSFPGVILGRKTVAVLEKLLAAAIKAAGDQDAAPTVLIEANEGVSILRFAMPAGDGGDVELIAKAVDGTFPDYSRVIPSEPELALIVNKAALAAAVKRMMLFSAGKSRAVRIEAEDDRMTVSAASPETGDASEELTCSYQGPPLSLGFDGKYLRDALAPIAADTVALRTDGEATGAVRISAWNAEAREETGALVQVLMPVRVSGLEPV